MTIPITQFCITDNSKFRPSTQGIFEDGNWYVKCCQNASAEDKLNKVYKPKLTVYKRGYQVWLKIEFSAPKLVFGDNVNELQEDDFLEVVARLRAVLARMGVRLPVGLLENAPISAVHPSKNISLTNGYTAIFAIRELVKISVSEKFDMDFKEYRNGGEELQIYSQTHSLAFYDKINDLTKPEKRAIDRQQPATQISLFDVLSKRKPPIEILRMEARLNRRKKLNEVLRGLGFNENPTFRQIFNKEICQKILLHYWQEFFDGKFFLFGTTNNPQKYLQAILAKYPRLGIGYAIKLVGFIMLCK
ncbi:MAG: hypothetical protein WCX69_06300, partial [Candidatus Paceibacterota bacterium]